MDLGVAPTRLEDILESSPLKSRCVVGGLAAWTARAVFGLCGAQAGVPRMLGATDGGLPDSPSRHSPI
jgi:hypothetical protein